MYTKTINNSRKFSIKRLVLMFTAFFIFISVISTSLSPLASAQATDTASRELTDLEKQINTTLYRNALSVCFLHSQLSGGAFLDQNKRIDEGEAAKFNWFGGNGLNNLDVIAGAYLNTKFGSPTISKTGVVPCAKGSFIKEAFTALGFTDELSGIDQVYGFMCTLGFRRANKPDASTSVSDCKSGTGDWRRGEINGDSDSEAAKLKLRDTMISVTDKGVLSLSDAARYILFRETALNLCKADAGQEITSSVGAAVGAKIKVLDAENKEKELFFTWGSDRIAYSTTFGFGEGYSVGFISRNSAKISTVSNADYRKGYTIFGAGVVNIDGGLRLNSVGIGQPYYYAAFGIGSTNPCTQMATQANSYFGSQGGYKQYIAEHPSENVPPGSGGVAVEGGTGSGSSCGIEGIGWIVCPMLSFLGDVLANIFKGLADNFLSTDIKLLDTSSGTYSGWSIFRNFANVAFVIVFLIIIFSQITSIGITNYGLKKLLPRLVIAAILVNASFFICQIAVDLSNVLGYSLKTVFDNIAVSSGVATSDDASSNGFGIAALVTLVLVAGYAAYALLAVLIPVLLGAIVAALMIILMLVARKALIVLLVVIAPLAFVAFLLPNTEKLFGAWRKMFMTLLLLFPIVSIVFGASALASQIIKSVAPDDQITQIIAVGVAAVPLFFVPGLLKKSLDGVGGVGKALNGLAAKAGGGLGKAYSGSEYAKHRAGLKAEANAYTRAGTYSGKNPFRRVRSAANSKINSNGVFNTITGGYGQTKGNSAKKFESDQVRSKMEQFEANDLIDANGNFTDLQSFYAGKNTAHQQAVATHGAGSKQARSADVERRAAAALLVKHGAKANAANGGAVPGSSTAATARAVATTGGGQYRTNSAGVAIRPAGSSGNSGVPLTASQQADIDARTGALEASQAAEQDALSRGHSAEDAQAIGAAEYRLHDK